MIKLRRNGFYSLLVGFFLSLNLISISAQAASFKKSTKAALCMFALVGSDLAEAWSLTGGVPAPAPFPYVEGAMPTVPVFNNLFLNASSAEAPGPFRVNLYTKGASFQRITIKGLEYSCQQLVKDDVNNVYYLTGNSSEINQVFANLSVHIADPYENRIFLLETLVNNGTSYTGSGSVRNMVFSGTSIPTPPDMTPGGIFITPFNGGDPDRQIVRGALWGQFQSIDKKYDSNAPGIEEAVLTCSGAHIMVGQDLCPSPCSAPFNLALADAFALVLIDGEDVFDAPECYASVIDGNSLSSPQCKVNIQFKRPLTQLEKIYENTIKPFLISSGCGLTVFYAIGKQYKGQRKEIDVIAAKVASELDLDIQRFAVPTIGKNDQEQQNGPEPVVGKLWKAKSGEEFQAFIQKILDEIYAKGFRTDNRLSIAVKIALAIKDRHQDLLIPNSGCRRSLNCMLGKHEFNSEIATEEKIQAIADSVGEALSKPKKDESKVQEAEHSQVEMVDIEKSDQ